MKEGPSAIPAPTSELEEAAQLLAALHISLGADLPAFHEAAGPAEPGAQPGQGEASPASDPPKGSLARQAAPSSSRRAGRAEPDLRFYAVWAIPEHPEARGVWAGAHPACWQAIQRLCPQGRYCSGVRLRRYPTLEEAIEAYEAEAGRRDAPAKAVVHRV